MARKTRITVAFDGAVLDRLHQAYDATGIAETAIIRRAVALYRSGAESSADAMDRVRIRLALGESR